MSDLKYIILDKIKQNIVCEKVQVNNKSHLHQHHAQSPKNNNSHFELIISSAELKKLSFDPSSEVGLCQVISE